MDDDVFIYPLTLKVRLPDAWKTVAAQQAGAATKAKRIQHQGAAYAMVQAIPDAGPITLTAR